MSYYTSQISLPLAKKLKEKGMPIEMQPLYAPEAPNARGIVKAGVGLWCPPYAEVFDWLMKEEIYITIERNILDPAHYHGEVFRYTRFETLADGDTWHEAANAAIEKALELI